MTQMGNNIPAVPQEGVVEIFRHVNVAPQNATQRKLVDLSDSLHQMMLSLILPHSQLQLAHCPTYLYCNYNILRILII